MNEPIGTEKDRRGGAWLGRALFMNGEWVTREKRIIPTDKEFAATVFKIWKAIRFDEADERERARIELYNRDGDNLCYVINCSQRESLELF